MLFRNYNRYLRAIMSVCIKSFSTSVPLLRFVNSYTNFLVFIFYY